MEHLDADQIVLLALGERDDQTGLSHSGPDGELTDPAVSDHLGVCDVCRSDLAQLSRTVGLARQAGELGLQTPLVLPASIWSGIADELGIGVGSPSTAPVADPSIPDRHPGRVAGGPAPSRVGRPAHHRPADGRSRRRTSWQRGLLVAAAMLVVGAGVGTGVAIGRPDSAVSAVQSEAALTPMSAGPSSAHGTATVTEGADGLTLNVTARQLPLRQGYYEVWLYDPTANQMVAVGTLGTGGDGAWTLASTIDLRSYSVVDVSAQDFNGNPAHQDSMLRGTLTQ